MPLGDVINGGIVTFYRLSNAKSKIMLQFEYDPQVSSKMWEMYWEWCLCACREIWSDARNSSKSAVARQGHGAVRFEVIAQTLFMTNGPNA